MLQTIEFMKNILFLLLYFFRGYMHVGAMSANTTGVGVPWSGSQSPSMSAGNTIQALCKSSTCSNYSAISLPQIT